MNKLCHLLYDYSTFFLHSSARVYITTRCDFDLFDRLNRLGAVARVGPEDGREIIQELSNRFSVFNNGLLVIGEGLIMVTLWGFGIMEANG